MINVKDKRCIEEGCNIIPVFNYENEKTPLYCNSHKKNGMVNIKDKKCIEEGCNIIPTFNYENNTTPIYCSSHKKKDMINIVSKTCEYVGCRVSPSYNYKNETNPLYCKSHKLENMVNVVSPMCIHPNCETQPVFNYETETTPLYCNTHKLENMVNISGPKCKHPGCRTQPSFNFKDKDFAEFCAVHKTKDMVDVKHNSCKSKWCNTIVEYTKYDGYCLFCFVNLFPDKPVSRNYKTKEHAVVEYINSKFPDVTWRNDKRIQDGCSLKRPDMLCDLGEKIVIIEINERKHVSYKESCENKRIMQISKDLDHRPLIFINFNPDNYLEKDKQIESCWTFNKAGLSVIKKTKQKEWITRLETLEKEVKYWLNLDNKSTKTIKTVNLFYDTT
jgi:hypothetical protein